MTAARSRPPARPAQRPTFEEETALTAQGYRVIAGVDEAGRGPLAGPVVAAAVVPPPGLRPAWLGELRDSKLLTPRLRGRLQGLIQGWALASGVGVAGVDAIDSQGILAATRLAMARAVAQLSIPPQFLLIDGLRLPELPLPQKGLIRGDARCASIAAASILAKVARDSIMAQMELEHPGYGFARHKGYGTREHLQNLARLGACPIHRRSFAPVRRALGLEGKAMPGDRQRTGALGERLARSFLQERGFAILETNFRCPQGEIDIVAQQGEYLVFVEVRARRGRALGTPEESVTEAKKQRLLVLAQAYLEAHPHPTSPWRVDVVAVELGRRGPPEIRLIENALG